MFNFSLQTVLEVRERLERIKYKEFSEELFERQKLENEITSRKEGMARAAGSVDHVKQHGASAAPLQLYGLYRQRLAAEIDLYAEQLREQDQAVEEKRKELVEARRAHRALEILRDKELQRYEKAQARQDRALMDEVASNYHLHQQ